MTRDRIGGDLGLTALDLLTGDSYDPRAKLHRPSDPAALAAEVRRLHGLGLTAADISVALRLDLAQVRETLQPKELLP
jgi:hypothetical protein